MYFCGTDKSFRENTPCGLSRGILIFLSVCLTFLSGTLYAGDIDNGKKVFVKCQACHSVEKDISKIGPSLYGVFGRKSGTLASFSNYTEAMKTANITWEKKTLSEFLKAPRSYVPNTLMIFPGLNNDKEIDDLLTYLELIVPK